MKAWNDNPWVWVVSFKVLSTTGRNNIFPYGGGKGEEKQILFSTPMIKAILDGTKTQTRRIIKAPTIKGACGFVVVSDYQGLKYPIAIDENEFHIGSDLGFKCPYGKPGDILWVRETWCNSWNINTQDWDVIFKASEGYVYDEDGAVKWKPSIHMPKSAARIWLQIEDIRIERLQDIGYSDAKNEGVEQVSLISPAAYRDYLDTEAYHTFSNPIDSFKSLWDSINGKTPKPPTKNPKLRTQNIEPKTKQP